MGYAYQPRWLPVRIDGAVASAAVEAYTFVADRQHRHYAGDLGTERAAEIIMDAAGCAGLNRDYLINTVRHLEKDGFVDPSLHVLRLEIERLTGLIDLGAGI